MPSLAEHLQKAEDNKKFAESMSLDTPTQVGWALTVLFYSALHLVDAFGAKYNHHPKSHKERNGEVNRNPQLEAIAYKYNDLYQFSRNARYETNKYPRSKYSEMKECLNAIESHIRMLL